MLDRWGGFGTFLFFGLINLTFIPFIYVFYPETKGRSLEEIDVIFAKAYCTGEWSPSSKKNAALMPWAFALCFSNVKVADEMPKLTAAEIEEEARRWGLAEGENARGVVCKV